MKKHFFPILTATIGLLTLAFGLGCSSNGGTDYTVKPTGVRMSASILDLEVRETAVIMATVQPDNASNKKVIWLSHNPSVATVNEGVVTAWTSGSAVITATPEGGGVTPGICTVYVTVPVEEVSINIQPVNGIKRLSLNTGDNPLVPIAVSVTPVDARDRRVTWTSSEPRVASVNEGNSDLTYVLNTVVRAVGQGVTTISATSADGKFSDFCIVNVTSDVTIPVDGINVSPAELDVLIGESALLTATISPADATDKFVIWESKRPAYASVESIGVDGSTARVRGVAEGAVEIHAIAADGSFRSVALVNVVSNISVTGVTLNKKDLAMVVGYEEALIPTVQPANATNKGVTWISTDPLVADVSSVGKVTPLKPGRTTIRVFTDDGSFSEECTVTVNNLFVSGHEYSGQTAIAKLWVNDKPATLNASGNNADAHSVFVKGEDVYVTGYEKNDWGVKVAKVWQIDAATRALTNDVTSGAGNSVFVSAFNEIFVAGYAENSNNIAVATLWRDGQIYSRLTNGGGWAEAKSVFVSGNNVYAAGYDTNNMGFTVPFLSLNGNTQFLTDGSRSACASSVYFWGGNTYVAGWENDQYGKPVPVLWENGTMRPLGNNRNGMANSVYVSASGGVYVAGYEVNGMGVAVATVWRIDGSVMSLTNGGSEAVANSVYILGTDVYVVGYEHNAGGKPEAKIWCNGFARTIGTQQGVANSIVIAPPVW